MSGNHRERERDRDRGDCDAVESLVAHMQRRLHATKTDFRPLPGFQQPRDAPASGDGHFEQRYKAGVDCDEVYPNIFVGDAGTARNKQYLQRLGITHVLNCAEGTRFGHVDTGPNYYHDIPVRYLGLRVSDVPVADIKRHFNEVATFIAEALDSRGRVLVHCLMGISRSSTCVMAFLMLHRGCSAAKAIETVRRCRDVRPNPGFMRQLAQLELELYSRG